MSTKLQNLNETTLVFNYNCIFATQRTNNMKYDSPYFEFIENNHPQYYSDDRVLLCDILFRFISDDGVSEDDLEWIEETIKTKSEALQELKRLEALLFSEALAYKQQAGCSVANH